MKPNVEHPSARPPHVWWSSLTVPCRSKIIPLAQCARTFSRRRNRCRQDQLSATTVKLPLPPLHAHRIVSASLVNRDLKRLPALPVIMIHPARRPPHSYFLKSQSGNEHDTASRVILMRTSTTQSRPDPKQRLVVTIITWPVILLRQEIELALIVCRNWAIDDKPHLKDVH